MWGNQKPLWVAYFTSSTLKKKLKMKSKIHEYQKNNFKNMSKLNYSQADMIVIARRFHHFATQDLADFNDFDTSINTNYLATNTMESLSKEVGFSSYNPFFTCFKDVVGKSPHQYISSINSILNK